MNAPTTPDEVRKAILDAAMKRFEHYGYRKTTMAEIAADCGMSAANLYRYYGNKEDIGAACAHSCMDKRIGRLREVVRQPGLTAPQRLETFALTLVGYNHDWIAEQPRMHELSEMVLSERPGEIRAKLDKEGALLAEILAQGNAAGEFDVADVVAMAQTVQAAFAIFDAPTFVGLFPREEYEREAVNLAALLVRGLAPR
jgi:AcrR family transcriptional regulator